MNVFDIIGPIMIGPSSSHTAGAVRLGRVAWKMLGEEPVKAEIALAGSFAMTGHGHGTDKALIAGCMGMHAYDERIRDALEIADSRGIEYTFENISLPDAHPNTAVIHLVGESGKETTVQGASIGGANVMINHIDGMDVEFTGQSTTVLVRHYDRPGVIALVANFMSAWDINIGNFRLSRKKKGGEAQMMIEVDGDVPADLPETLEKLPNVIKVIVIRKV